MQSPRREEAAEVPHQKLLEGVQRVDGEVLSAHLLLHLLHVVARRHGALLRRHREVGRGVGVVARPHLNRLLVGHADEQCLEVLEGDGPHGEVGQQQSEEPVGALDGEAAVLVQGLAEAFVVEDAVVLAAQGVPALLDGPVGGYELLPEGVQRRRRRGVDVLQRDLAAAVADLLPEQLDVAGEGRVLQHQAEGAERAGAAHLRVEGAAPRGDAGAVLGAQDLPQALAHRVHLRHRGLRRHRHAAAVHGRAHAAVLAHLAVLPARARLHGGRVNLPDRQRRRALAHLLLVLRDGRGALLHLQEEQEELVSVALVAQRRADLGQIRLRDAAVGVLAEARLPRGLQVRVALVQLVEEVLVEAVGLGIEVLQRQLRLLVAREHLPQDLVLAGVAEAPEALHELVEGQLALRVGVEAGPPGPRDGAVLADAEVLERLDRGHLLLVLVVDAGLGELLPLRRVPGAADLEEEAGVHALVEGQLPALLAGERPVLGRDELAEVAALQRLVRLRVEVLEGQVLAIRVRLHGLEEALAALEADAAAGLDELLFRDLSAVLGVDDLQPGHERVAVRLPQGLEQLREQLVRLRVEGAEGDVPLLGGVELLPQALDLPVQAQALHAPGELEEGDPLVALEVEPFAPGAQEGAAALDQR
mmetsp:Transcript_5893/g.14956  ORF Transcript_5893/g.14956 Transcript_5893/m.14956 type:complete len:645 (+) Transcript_5893:824-2758(+)